jgi:hypothetical protein
MEHAQVRFSVFGLFSALILTVAGCSTEPIAQNTGGIDIEAGPCGRGLVVVSSDYQSTNVSVIGFDGKLLSSSLISSASGDTALSAPLSGDVVLPTEPQTGSEIVVIDRLNSVLTWVDVRSGVGMRQLPVGTGFGANPHDYLDLGDNRAYVTRFEPNLAAGAQDFDQGNDILVVAPEDPAITGRIDLMPAIEEAEEGIFPRVDRAVKIGDRVFVTLAALSLDFLPDEQGRLAILDASSHELIDVVVFEGLAQCTGIAVSPSQDEIALTCIGGSTEALDSGIVLLEVGAEIRETARFPASTFDVPAVGFYVDYADEDTLFFATFGSTEPNVADKLFRLHTATAEYDELAQSVPYSLGQVQCLAECGQCFAADAEMGKVRRFSRASDGKLVEDNAFVVDENIGLAPRSLGRF